VKSVLHVSTGLENGGAEAVLYRLCRQDTLANHHVVSLGGEGKYGPLLAQAGIEVTCLDLPRGRVGPRALARLRDLILKARPDVVQTWMYHANLMGGIMARLAGHRNVCWNIRQASLDTKLISRSTRLVDRACASLSSRVPRRIICCADRARQLHEQRGYDARRMMVIHNGYEFSTFKPAPAKAESLRMELMLEHAQPVIGFVARFHPFKDHLNLLRALSELRRRSVRPTCLLVGTGMEESNAELVRLIGSLQLRNQIRLLGPRDDIPAVMNLLDLHVMSSRSEGFPNVLAEAMACGTPCVSTDVGDAAIIVGDTGRIVPPCDHVALSDAIADMLAARQHDDWATRQETARRHIMEHFSIDRMIDSYHRAWFDQPLLDSGDDPAQHR
jgi:glycosyltransferase involved in cell wall biosynthesis